MKLAGPRGAFLGYKNLEKRLKNTTKSSVDLAFAMGMLHELIIISGFLPNDVEYVLDIHNRLVAIDFGLVYRVGGKDRYGGNYHADMDMYIPENPNHKISNERAAFVKGKQIVQDWRAQFSKNNWNKSLRS